MWSGSSPRAVPHRAPRPWPSPTTRTSPLAAAAETTIDLDDRPGAGHRRDQEAHNELLAVAALSVTLEPATPGDAAGATDLAAVPDAMASVPRARAGDHRDGRRPGRRRPAAHPRPWLRVRDRARVGAQAQGTRPRLRRPVFRGGLRTRPTGAARAGRTGDRRVVREDPARRVGAGRLLRPAADRPGRRPGRRQWDDADALALARWPLRLPAGTPEWLGPIVSILVGQLPMPCT